MKKNASLNIRFEVEERAALDRAAEQDDRLPTALARKIILDWLRANGFLVKP